MQGDYQRQPSHKGPIGNTLDKHILCATLFLSFPIIDLFFGFMASICFFGGQHAEMGCNVLQCVRSTPCHKRYVLQHVAVCCSVLQRVVVCCSVL